MEQQAAEPSPASAPPASSASVAEPTAAEGNDAPNVTAAADKAVEQAVRFLDHPKTAEMPLAAKRAFLVRSKD